MPTATIGWAGVETSNFGFVFWSVVWLGVYRYGFNGQEKSDEIKGSGNSYTAEFWEYDPRIGKRWNTDPVVDESESPYATHKNSPISFSDPNGDCPTCPKKDVTNPTDNTGNDPSGNLINMGDTKGLRVQFTNLGSEEKADWRVTSFGRDGEGVGWNWNPEKKSFLNGKGEEFSNGLAMSIFNIAGLGVGNSFVEFSTNIATGQPLKDTRAAYGQYTQANGGSGTWAGFAWNGLSNGISNWWGDLNAGGNRTQNALLGTWLFSADLVRGSSFTLGTGKMGVFRVQGRGKYLLPDGAGNLVFNSMNGKPKTIYMFMGNYQDALAFAAKKPGSTITAFTINSRYANTILRAKHAQAMGLKSISASDAHVARGYFRIAVHSNKMQGFLNWTYKGSARILQPK